MELKALGGYQKLQAKHSEVKVSCPACLFKNFLGNTNIIELFFGTTTGVGLDQ